jgi:hypothetical protein
MEALGQATGTAGSVANLSTIAAFNYAHRESVTAGVMLRVAA